MLCVLPCRSRLRLPQAVLLRHFAPYSWHGPRAVDSWWNDFGSFSKRAGMSDLDVELLPAVVADVEGDRAYVVVPGVITGLMNGKKFRISGRNTAVLWHVHQAWRIAAWTWSDDGPE